MVLWFVGLSVVLVWLVFQSPALDVRVVALGALVPWFDGLTGGPFVLHTLVGSVGALALVMLATREQRVLRRRVLGVPIGMFLHLVLDGSWGDSERFWWPFLGGNAFAGRLPELDRAAATMVLLEALGAIALWWAAHAFGLDEPARREELRRTGRLRPR